MSRSYYYFAASLPMIDWDGKVPVSSEDFLSDCQRLLSEDDYVLMEKILIGNDSTGVSGNSAADAWLQFNNNFRNELAFFRAQRVGKDPLNSVRGSYSIDSQLRDVIHQISKMSNLLEAEKILDKTYWQFLTDLASGHYYDFEYLIVYGIKLKILERHQEYNSPKGRSTLDEMRMTELHESCILESSSVVEK